jgi:gas vesicle protein
MADNKSDFLVGLLVGGALGAAIALLYAPQSGEDTRDTLKKKSDELKDKAGETYGKVKEQTASLASQVKDSSTTMAASVKESAGQVASRVSETVGKVKDDVVEGLAKTKATSSAEAKDLSQNARAEVDRLKQAVNNATDAVTS